MDRIHELRIEAGIARLADDPWLAVIDKNGKVIDPLIGIEKFAELIIKECIDIMDKERYNSTMLTSNPMQSGAICDAKWKIKNHFGVK